MAAVTIPVVAKTRIGHIVEAQILQALGVDLIDESEGVLFLNAIYDYNLRRWKINPFVSAFLT